MAGRAPGGRQADRGGPATGGVPDHDAADEVHGAGSEGPRPEAVIAEASDAAEEDGGAERIAPTPASPETEQLVDRAPLRRDRPSRPMSGI